MRIRMILLSATVSLALAGCLDLSKEEQGSTTSASQAPELPVNHPSTSNDSGAVTTTSEALSADVLGSRMYLRSFLTEIFQTSNSTGTYNLNLALDKYLGSEYEDGVSGQAAYDYIMLFGGACSYYSEAGWKKACASSTANLYLPMSVPSNTSRESVRVKVCAEVTQDDILVAAALDKIGLTKTSAVDGDGVTKIFELFYPGVVIDSNTKKALLDLNTAMKNNKESLVSQWRLLLFTLCRTPEWQSI